MLLHYLYLFSFTQECPEHCEGRPDRQGGRAVVRAGDP